MEKIRLGIIGVGQISVREHLPAFYQDSRCRVIAVADPDESRIRLAQEDFGVPGAYLDWRCMLAEAELDAITIATPPRFHHEIAMAVLEKGIPILLEKPVTVDLEQLDDIIAASQAKACLVMAKQPFRYEAVFDLGKQVIERGELGVILAVQARFGHPGPQHWAPDSPWYFHRDVAGGGVLMDLGVHIIDTVCYLLGDEAVKVGAVMGTRRAGCEVEDQASVIAEFSQGTIASINADWNSMPGHVSIQVSGTEAGMVCEWYPEPKVEIYPCLERVRTVTGEETGERGVVKRRVELPAASRWGGAYRHFIDCLAEEVAPVSPIQDVRNSMAIIFSSYASGGCLQAEKLALWDRRLKE